MHAGWTYDQVGEEPAEEHDGSGDYGPLALALPVARLRALDGVGQFGVPAQMKRAAEHLLVEGVRYQNVHEHEDGSDHALHAEIEDVEHVGRSRVSQLPRVWVLRVKFL